MPKTIEISAEGLWLGKGLTKRQGQFCIEYFRTKAVAREAYKRAGFNVRTNESARAAASRLLRNVCVRQQIERIAAMVRERAADVTADSLISELEEARQVSRESGQGSAMAAATMGKARITGHIVDRKEVGSPGDFEKMSEDELRAFIKDRLPNAMQTNADVPQATSASDTESVSALLPSHLPPPTHGGSNTPQ